MGEPVLIGADWGTSALRTFLIGAGGEVLDRRESADGILAVRGGAFEAALAAAVGRWRGEHPRLPVLLSGMIGSRQGWCEAPYVPLPAGPDQLAEGFVAVGSARLGTVRIVPGVVAIEGEWPDVMRGEETEIVGALARLGRADGLFVAPGTHAKWIAVESGRIARFRTYMTGEVFAALRDHTILGRLMKRVEPLEKPAEPDETSPELRGFSAGVRAARELAGAGALLARLFSIRSLGLFDRLAPDEAEAFLSGLLIGSEIADAAGDAPEVTVIAGERLTRRYLHALRLVGTRARAAPPECAAAGQFALARAAGLIG